MQHVKMPAFYYPTQVVLIDDNISVLKSIKDTLELHGITCQSFEDPEKALIYLESLPIRPKLTLSPPEEEEDVLATNTPHLTLDFDVICKQMKIPSRFSEISVIVSDYDMPQMKGSDFFSFLSKRNWKRIMLTGHTDYELAVKMLNQKLIDNYVEKRMGEVNTLLQQVAALQQVYFNDLAAPIVDHIFSKDSYVHHTDYKTFIEKIIQENNIAEHYTFSSSGSKFLIDKSKNKFALMIATEDEMAGYHNTAQFADTPESVLQKLKGKTHMPLLVSIDDLNKSPTDWGTLMLPATKIMIDGKALYYALGKIS